MGDVSSIHRCRARWVILLFGAMSIAGCGLPPGVEKFSEDDMTAPVLESSPPLEPPPAATADGQEGVVEIECIITIAGKPEACGIERDLPGGLGQAVLEMVRRQHYRPALKDGKPAAVLITLPFVVRHPLPADWQSVAAKGAELASHAGKRARAPKVRMGMTTVVGRLHPEIIQRVVRANFGRFRRCYEYGLAKNPNLEGRVTIDFAIDGRGYVVAAAVASSDLPSAFVASCVRSAFFGFKFPRPEGGNVRVQYPVMFAPPGD